MKVWKLYRLLAKQRFIIVQQAPIDTMPHGFIGIGNAFGEK